MRKRLTPACLDFTYANRLLDIIVSLLRMSAKARNHYTHLTSTTNVFWWILNAATSIFILSVAGGTTSGCCVLCRPDCIEGGQDAYVLEWGYLWISWPDFQVSPALILRNMERCGLMLRNFSLPSTSRHTPSPKLVCLRSHLFWIINKVTDLLFLKLRHPPIAIIFSSVVCLSASSFSLSLFPSL